MSNRNELRAARKRADAAANELAQIEALPRRIGDRVVWSNGVIWERLGDDRWWPTSATGDGPTEYPSAHVASGDWSPVPSPGGE